MNTINRLGIRIVGVTLGVLLVVFGLWKGVAALVNQSKVAQQPTPTPIVDEILPTQSPIAPLPPELQQQITSYTATAEKSIGVYTKKYVESLPPETPKEQVLAQKSVEAFVLANQGTLLPELFTGTLQTTTQSGKQAIQTYLYAISPVQNAAIKPITGDMITTAFTQQESGENPEALVAIRASIENNFTIFKSVKAPKEATELHTKLLQATLALMNNITLLQEIKNDFIGGLIGQKNLADLNAVFTNIGAQILTLETKYNIK